VRALKFAPLLILLLCSADVRAQDCKIRFAVAYLNGNTLQVGLTPEQLRFWRHNGPAHYPGLCLDDQKPDHLIIWMRGTPDEGAARAAALSFRRTHGEEALIETRASAVQGGGAAPAGAQGYYWLFDLSKNPAAIVDRGEPLIFRHGEAGGTSIDPRGHDLTPNTVAVIDDIQAIKLPLDKLKKSKK